MLSHNHWHALGIQRLEHALPLESEGGGEFSMEEAGLSIQFNAEKTMFTLDLGGQKFDLTKE